MKRTILALLITVAMLTGSVVSFSPRIVPAAVAAVGDIIASDNFESGNWVGGGGTVGWLDGWQYSDAEVTPLLSPHGGSYHMHIYHYYGNGWAKREIDLSGKSNLRLQFWVRTANLQTGEWAKCEVSPDDGAHWWATKTWTTNVGTDQLVDVDLTCYNMTSTFWIRFSISGSLDLYIDDLEIVQGSPHQCPSDPSIASDNFESGNWVGGGGTVGWLDGWQYSDAEVTPLLSPHGGSYHMHIYHYYGNGWAKREIDLSGKSNLRLQFWVRIDSLDQGEYAVCQVSPDDGTNWWAGKTWITNVDGYQSIDIDLSPYTMTNTFWVRFSISGSLNLFVDDLKITAAGYPTWDINQDGKVDYKDLAILGAHYGQTASPPYPAWDINQDGKVDYRDLAILGAHYGETY